MPGVIGADFFQSPFHIVRAGDVAVAARGSGWRGRGLFAGSLLAFFGHRCDALPRLPMRQHEAFQVAQIGQQRAQVRGSGADALDQQRIDGARMRCMPR